METIELTILASDIADADHMDSSDCPITRAFRRAGKPWVHAGSGGILSSVTYPRYQIMPHNQQLDALWHQMSEMRNRFVKFKDITIKLEYEIQQPMGN